MIAAIATIVFIAAAWAAVVAIAASLDDSPGRVLTALRGETPSLTPAPIALRISQRYPTARAQRVRARPAMRAAA